MAKMNWNKARQKRPTPPDTRTDSAQREFKQLARALQESSLKRRAERLK